MNCTGIEEWLHLQYTDIISDQLKHKVPYVAYDCIHKKIKHNICHFQCTEVPEYSVHVEKGDQAGG